MFLVIWRIRGSTDFENCQLPPRVGRVNPIFAFHPILISASRVHLSSGVPGGTTLRDEEKVIPDIGSIPRRLSDRSGEQLVLRFIFY